MKRRATPRKPSHADDPAGLRRRAESRLNQRTRPAVPRRTDADSARLLHELEVHQIELEMQNAELRDVRDEVEAALVRYTDLYEFAPTGYFSLDAQGLILEANLTGATLLGAHRSQVVGRSFRSFVAGASRPVHQAFLERVFERPEKQTCQMSLRRQDGAELWADVQSAPATSLRNGRRWCRVSVSDITALKRAEEAQLRSDALAARNRELNLEIERRHKVETSLKQADRRQAQLLDESRDMQEQLRQLSRGILHAQEEERKRISRELHDVVAQSAVGINIHLELLGREATGKSEARRKRIEQTRRLFEELMEVVHRFSRELRPTVLDDLGLIPALESLTKEFSRRTGIGVQLTPVAAVDQLDSAKRTVLYRVAQEALTNVARHAHATRARLSIRKTRDGICLEVADDGTSFDVVRALAAKTNQRLGLLGMRERVEMVGGAFSIDSAPGKGTCVRARIPLAGGDGVRRSGSRPTRSSRHGGVARGGK